MIRSMFIVALGGAVGSSLRMAVSRIVDTYAVGHFPYPTMTVNVVGWMSAGKSRSVGASGETWISGRGSSGLPTTVTGRSRFARLLKGVSARAAAPHTTASTRANLAGWFKGG